MAYTLKVTPEQLLSAASQFESTSNNIKAQTSNMTNLVSQISGSVWSGEAATAYKNKFRALDDDISRMITTINKEVVQDLKTIAQQYKTTEQKNISDAGSLPTTLFN